MISIRIRYIGFHPYVFPEEMTFPVGSSAGDIFTVLAETVGVDYDVFLYEHVFLLDGVRLEEGGFLRPESRELMIFTMSMGG